MKSIPFFCLIITLMMMGCTQNKKDQTNQQHSKPRILLDTDANNELDDQHALAYLLFNSDVFNIEGVTVNATRSGGAVENQYAEAKRVMQMCGMYEHIPLKRGANGSFNEIVPNLENELFDGSDAVNFIIEKAMENKEVKLVLVPVGKLTNIALALKKDPSIAEKVRVVWLGANYPEPGEYNLSNDTVALNYILNSEVPFEIAVVRPGEPSGTAAVNVSREEIIERMPGKGVQVEQAVEGRHGGSFTNFGDYSVSLFQNYKMDGDPPSRPLFDMAAVAIVKNAEWAESKVIPAPIYRNGQWVERPDNSKNIIIWENFKREAILSDFFETMNEPAIIE